MGSLSIRHKIWVGFGVLVALLMIVGAITQQSLNNNKRKLNELVNDVQPTVVTSLNLVDQLDRSSASLGFYLLSKEDVNKNNYIENIDKISETVAELKASQLINNDPNAKLLFSKIESDSAKLATYKDMILELASDESKNIPATKYSGENVNPLFQTMMQSFQEIILAEEEQAVSKERKTFLIEVANTRHILLGATNELRIFLAFRAEANVENFESMVEVLNGKLTKLKKYDDEFLSFEQVDSVGTFIDSYYTWVKNARAAFKIHRADDWRKDAYIVRTQISPLLLEIQDGLKQIVNSQHEKSIQDSDALTAQVNQTQLIIMSLIGFGLISAIIVGFLLARSITGPITSLKASAAEFAKGNLENEIDVSRKDELGSLASSFADMRDSIRKKIEDLHVLNTAGENLAGLHNQINVLQLSLQVMSEQTNVEWGSVYFHDKESNELEIKAFYPTNDQDHNTKPKSFRIGEGIIGKAAEEMRVIYISDTSSDTSFVANFDKNDTPKAIVCIPLIDQDKLIGVMNFCGEVGKVRFEDNDVEFAETVARMTVATFKNIQMLNVIEEQNRTLEEKVEVRTAELKHKTNDINNMLQNMHQGIFTIQVGNIIHPEYSTHLEEILETTQIENRNVMDVLFSDTDLGSNAIDQIGAALSAIIGEEIMMFDFNKHCLVNEFRKKTTSGDEKILELDWDPILLENDIIDKIMITVRDVTELRGLQAEAEQQKWELEVIGQILAISSKKFEGFIESAKRFINENEEYINKTDSADPVVLANLFRNMHTIKGNARTYGFNSITDIVHEAENTYDKIRKHQDLKWDKEKLLEELGNTRNIVNIYDRIYRDKLQGNVEDGVYIDQVLFDKGNEALENVNFNNKQSLTDSIIRIKNLAKAVGMETLPTMLESIIDSMPGIASVLGKETPTVVVKDNGIRLAPEIAITLKNVFTHCFRNAIDHGIEPTDVRTAFGKSPNGTITLEAIQKNDLLLFKLHDDGYGLPLELVRRKAVLVGLINDEDVLPDHMIAELIFHSGLTTTGAVTEVSGRGVGMDAVRKFLTELNGEIEISFTGPAEGEFRHRPFEIRILLPEHVYVKVA